MPSKRENRNLSLDEFIASPIPDAWEAIGRLDRSKMKLLENCNNFSECHIRVRESTGLWIEELVPVFQKLDASLAMKR